MKKRGFTLVELMVAAMLLSLITTTIFYIFQTTSESMRETQSRAKLLQRARQAISVISTDLRSAGAFASPDSKNDPKVAPDNGNYRVLGVASYGSGPGDEIGTGWQDQEAPIPDDLQDPNPMASFDGIVVMYPAYIPFEITDPSYSGSSITNVEIAAEESGLAKLIWRDNLMTKTTKERDKVWSDYTGTDGVFDQIKGRLSSEANILRVMDRDGFFQFGYIDSASGDNPPLTLTFEGDGQLEAKSNDQPHGLAPAEGQATDIGYRASAVASAWYYVERDVEDETNFILKKALGNSRKFAADFNDGLDSMNPNNNTETAGFPIVENVVDFQIWFDCANHKSKNEQAVQKVDWENSWAPPSGSVGDCMDPSSSPEPGRVRAAHVRLTLRADQERSDLAHQKWPFDDGDTTLSDIEHPMKTFDVDPGSEGAAPVVTVQADIELTNFALRAVNAH